MTRFPYATSAQLTELMRQSDLPTTLPASDALRMLAHAPAPGARTLRLVVELLTRGELDAQLRELVILRVVQRCEGRRAWRQHADIARRIGVSDAQIALLEKGKSPRYFIGILGERERAALEFADEVLERAHASPETLAAVSRRLSPRQLLEMLLLIGCLRMICGVMSTLQVEPQASFAAAILEMLRDSPPTTADRRSSCVA